MQMLSFFKTSLSKIFFVFLFFLISTNLHAARTITNITFISDANVTKNSTIHLEATVILDKNGTSYQNYYRGLAYRIGSGVWRCANSVPEMTGVNYNVVAATPIMKTITSRFVIHADQPAGVYDITFRATYDTSCNLNTPAAQSSDFTIPNAITISDGDPSYVLNFQHGMFSSTNKVEFDCEHLYLAADNVWRINSMSEGQPTTATRGIDMSEIYRPLADQRYSRTTASQKTPSDDFSGRGAIMRTMALGPYGENGTITAIHWHWSDIWRSDPGTAPAYIRNGTSSMTYVNPQPVQGNGWSGGEVNQMSGEIYFSGREDTTFSGTYEFMILDPLTGIYNKSGKVKPETPYDATRIDSGHVSSDMAIDAEGNFYVIAYDADCKSYSNLKDQCRYYWIVRVVPGNSTGTWKYNKVKRIGPYASPISQKEGATTPGATGDVWGVAFLNGKLYSILYMAAGNSALYEANPLTGEVFYKGNVLRTQNEQLRKYDTASTNGLDAGIYGSSDTVLYDPKDLASCQVAPVLRGKVYYDADGNGLLNDDEKKADGVANITIQLYDSAGRWIGEQETSGMGEYSFIVPINRPNVTTYYIRMKQPQINGANVPQTWADGGIYEYTGRMGGNNTATPTCYNGVSPIYNPTTYGTYAGQDRHTYDTTCFGARSDGIDASTDSISAANYYTRIDFMTDRAVAYANFAVSGADRSDSPENFGEVSQAVMHKSIYLGQGVSVDNISIFDDNANKDTLDDGVLVKDANNASENFTSLQDYLFENKRTYTFRVFANSETYGKDGYLHGWMSLSKSNNSVVTNYNNGLKITDAAMIGNVSVGSHSGIKISTSNSSFDFNYTIPDKVITTNTAGGNKSKAFFRFRYLSNNSTSSPVKNSAEANTQPWVTEGEVEDYKVIYKYSAVPPLTGNVTIWNYDETKDLYARIAGSSFKVLVVYLDNQGNKIKPQFNNLKADINFIADNGQNISIKTNFSVINATNELKIDNFNKAIKSGKFEIKYYLGSNTNDKRSSESTSFGIRPDRFIVDINNKLIGGKNEDIKIIAAEYGSENPTTGYNQLYSEIKDRTLNNLELTKCNTRLNKDEFNTNGLTQFTNGTIDGTVAYNNVGDLKLKFTDNKWITKNCISNSSANDGNGKNGCDIVSDEVVMTFIPQQFQGNLQLRNFNNGPFTYISNNNNVGEVMYAIADTSISALLFGGGVATNYHENCYAFDVSWGLALINNPVNWLAPDNWTKPNNWPPDPLIVITPQNSISFFADNPAQAAITQNNPQNGIGGGTATIQTTQNNFQNGIAANLPIGFNFSRQINAPQNPFTVNSGDFSINQIRDVNVVNAPLFTTVNSNAIFLFGRVTSKEYTGPRNLPHIATMRYEAFCDIACNAGGYPALSLTSPRIESSWYINTRHNNLRQGEVLDLGDSLGNNKITIAQDRSLAIVGGFERRPILTLNPIVNPVYYDDILINTRSWLLHDENINAIRNRFKVTFTGPGGGWAGDGQVSGADNVGRVIQQNPSDRIKQAVDW